MSAVFNLGAIVQLKSGGPAMTVSKKQDDLYLCEWFKGATKEKAYFSEHTLKEYIAPKKND